MTQQHESERPVLAAPVKHDDPVWIAIKNLGTAQGVINDRVNRLEPAIDEAREAAAEALIKVNQLAHAQVASAENLARAVAKHGETSALFVAHSKSVKASLRWLMILILLFAMLNGATLAAVLAVVMRMR